MPNPLNPTVEIELGDETRNLKLDFNAMAAAEAATGRSMFQIGAILARPTITDLTAIAWACLLHEDPTLKLAEVRALIGFHNRSEILAAITEMVARCFPEPKAADEADADAPLAPTSRRSGKPSGAPDATTSG